MEEGRDLVEVVDSYGGETEKNVVWAVGGRTIRSVNDY
jgi:hypothetical protein